MLLIDEEKENYCEISLYFGPAEQTLKPNASETGILNAIDKRVFHFPKDEFNGFMIAIEAMKDQKNVYKKLERKVAVGFQRNEMLL